ncbi:Sec-independent protein translocase protein TatB [Kushneria aurantia]|uniref:Sec-independent protein translocase protein TatB n=1 Tax=Kushneria aurantia TaxID=504092 RepID=A0ABV6G705_9GAMM|nr:Sec-independent protein translocase protein TatB [Kushneria aurantia]
MFDVSFPELIVIGTIALIVLGPERLPTAARTTGLWLGKIKRTVSSVQKEITSQLETEDLQRRMKDQQDRFDRGLKKAREDIEDLGDDASGRQKSVSERALGDSAERPAEEETQARAASSATHASDSDDNDRADRETPHQ